MKPKKVEMPTMSIDKYKEMKVMNKKFVTLKEGVALYSMSHENFRNIAEEAGALYKINRKVLVNVEVFEEYLESFRVWR